MGHISPLSTLSLLKVLDAEAHPTCPAQVRRVIHQASARYPSVGARKDFFFLMLVKFCAVASRMVGWFLNFPGICSGCVRG